MSPSGKTTEHVAEIDKPASSCAERGELAGFIISAAKIAELAGFEKQKARSIELSGLVLIN